jgi:hypothetical protein
MPIGIHGFITRARMHILLLYFTIFATSAVHCMAERKLVFQDQMIITLSCPVIVFSSNFDPPALVRGIIRRL